MIITWLKHLNNCFFINKNIICNENIVYFFITKLRQEIYLQSISYHKDKVKLQKTIKIYYSVKNEAILYIFNYTFHFYSITCYSVFIRDVNTSHDNNIIAFTIQIVIQCKSSHNVIRVINRYHKVIEFLN